MELSGHVAIVDDDASTRAALAQLLAAHKIDCRTYPLARAFLAALPSAMPFCLIVDVNMPEMTGLDLQRELLQLGIHIPTIVITAVEPLTREELMAAINSAARLSGTSLPKRHH